ncbi:glycoside hydrolase [Linderina pennispora]|uniref:Trehalase n=1 Tax=Linderina pennispora TaxID=61395 RepID=A0A1Y1W6X1_9FUNG|nr:glycoside hydrolase [Linderina pennispora]ORX69125.1 glycoside hydrolase [Linderina pennispora]
MRVNLSLTLAALLSVSHAKGPCDSPIYCEGDILHAVQMAKLYPDDKTFVDKPTIKPLDDVLAAFKAIGGTTASRSAIASFVDANFGLEGTELKAVNLTEFTSCPKFLSHIHNPLLRAYGGAVNGFWKDLVREQDLTSLCGGCVSSMLPLKYHFVVPGGRFREIYYWDTYFTMEGLLRSELYDTARSNIEDLLDLVDSYGFVPNGARVYYLDRSQPPLLTLMVKIYFEHTNDLAFVKKALPTLKKEHGYWIANHSVSVPCKSGSVTLNRYIAGIYADMATGAETGWDYSTRWVRNPKAPADQLLFGIRTRQVVPVELNAILYQVEQAIARLDRLAGAGDCSDYEQMAATRLDAMNKVFYDSASGMYFDWVLETNSRSTIWSPAALWPYWSFGSRAPQDGGKRAFDYLAGVLSKNPGGVPTTLNNSGQQWDWPNVWPPLQYVLMQGALNRKDHKLATVLAQTYVDAVFCSWYNTGGSIPNVLAQLPGESDIGHMFEKFNSTSIGQQGGGGEYTVQSGFGWTNGVLLWALDTFGNRLATPQCVATKD